MSTTLQARSLTKRFAGHDGESGVVLDGVAVEAAPGDLVLVAGPAGCGRTTLLRCLAGTYRPDAGEVLLRRPGEDVDLAVADARTLAWVRQRHLAVFDGPLAAPPRLSAAVVVARAAATDASGAQAALARLGLASLAGVAIGRLRPSEARRVALAAALAKPAGIVLLDEPLLGCTGQAAAAVTAWIDDRRRAGDAVVATGDRGSLLVAGASCVQVLE